MLVMYRRSEQGALAVLGLMQRWQKAHETLAYGQWRRFYKLGVKSLSLITIHRECVSLGGKAWHCTGLLNVKFENFVQMSEGIVVMRQAALIIRQGLRSL